MFSKKKSYLNLEKQELERRNFKKVFLDQKVAKPSKPWVDDLFPPNENSLLGKKKTGEYLDPTEVKMVGPLMNPNGIEWKRAKDLVADPMLFEDKITVDSLRLGEIANTYYLSALAALAQYPNLINQIFITKKINQECVYQISLFIDGEFQIVFIDDFIPVIKGTTTPFFTKTNSFELWGLLLEKAWAKVNGGYANIVSCSLADLFRALTGCSCQTINTKEEDIFNIWVAMKNALNNKWVMCATVKGDEPKARKHGLVPGSTYNILFVEDVYDNQNKKQILVKMKNVWGANVWEGDFSEGSNAWTDSIIDQIGINRVNKNSDGEFWMSLKDIIKYFETIDICQLIFGAKTFSFVYKGNSLNVPQMYNINLRDTGILSISVYEKKWRFNRELKGMIHPTSLILAEYDPETKEIKKVYSNFSCDNDTEIAVKVNGGYYILWVYKPADLAKNKRPDFMKVRIASDEEISVKYVGPDNDFLGIADIVARAVRYKNKPKIKKEEFFYDIQNSLDKSGIAYRVVLNDTSDLYEDWDNDASSVEGIQLLPPYNKNKKFLFRVGPNSYVAVLGIQKEEYGTHWFNLKSKISQMPVTEKEGEIKNPMANPNTLYTADVDNAMEPEYITTSYDVSKEQAKFPLPKSHNNLYVNRLKSNYNRLMNAFSKSFPSEMKNNKLVPTEIKKGDLSFFGESNPKTKEGRGVFYDTKNDKILVTTWRDQDESSFGQIYNGVGNLIYEGEMVNGVAHGKGTFFFPGGEKYFGNFDNGVIEGNGVFFWDDGCRWEGTFSGNKLNGDGVFYNPRTKTSFNTSYRNNRIVEENTMGGGSGLYGSMRKKERGGDRGERENFFRGRDKGDRESGERELGRRMLFRGGRDRDRENVREVARENVREIRENIREKKEIMNNLGNVPIGIEREINREVDIDKDGNIEREKEEIIDREIPIDDGEREERRIGGGMMRFKNREMFREKNQREFVRERPPRGESEDNNDDEDERDSDKEEEIQNNIRNERFRRNNGRERYKKGDSDDEESDE